MIITPLKVTGSIYRSDQELMWELLIRRFLGRGIYVYTQSHTHSQTHKLISKSHCAADLLSYHHYKEAGKDKEEKLKVTRQRGKIKGFFSPKKEDLHL